MRPGRLAATLCLGLAFLVGGLGVPAAVGQTDPGAVGPLAVTREEYNFGDTAFVPPSGGFPGVEVRASVHYPTALTGGPFPFVVLLHGRHATCQQGGTAFLQWPCTPPRTSIESFKGYDYFSSVLASHGYIVISISANGINAFDNGVFDLGAQARAELTQHHLDRWQTFSTAGGAPFGTKFVGKVDLANVGTMGHSRGGEGVVRHFLHNASLASPYGIRAVFPLAPVDFNRPVINNVPLKVLLPYCDGDVSDLQGVHFFDDARYNVPGDTAAKHYVLVMGANHNFYNTVWTPGSGYAGTSDDWGFRGDPFCDAGSASRLTAAQQRGTGLAYMAGFFRRYLGGETAFDPMLRGDVAPPPSAMTTDLHLSYHAPAALRRDVNRLLTAAELTTNTLGGAASQSGFTPYDLCGGEFPQPQHCLSFASASQQPHTTPSARAPGVRGLSQLRGGWSALTAQYTNELPPGFRDVSPFGVLQFRVSVNFEDGRNPFGAPRDFSVRLVDGTGAVASVTVGSVSSGLYYPPGSVSPVPKVILNTVRIPLTAFGAVDLTDIRSVQFRFNQSASGALLISDIAFADGEGGPPAAGPNLMVTAVSNPPAVVVLKEKFSVTDTTANVGDSAAGESRNRYYFSTDMARGAGDKRLTGTRSVPALGPGGTSSGGRMVTVPGNTTLGTYFLIACADDFLAVLESDEGDNCLASATQVEVRAPDLAVTALTNPPASRARGGSFGITDTVTNQGNAAAGPTTNRYYLSADQKKGAGDTLLTGTRGVPGLAAGAGSSGPATLTVPGTAPTGAFFLLGCADDLKQVAESDEKDNCTASTTTVTITP